MIWQIRLGVCLFSLFAIPLCVYYFWKQDWGLMAVAMMCELLMIVCAMIVTKTIPGFLTNEIEIDERGITLYENGVVFWFLSWEAIATINKTRKYGTNALAVANRDGDEIWFFTSRKIEQYIAASKKEIEITRGVVGEV